MINNNDPETSDDQTFWEKVGNTRWGAYTTEIARLAILRGHHIAARPTVALEIGCEGGRWSSLLANLGWSMICVDTDAEVLKLCQKRIPSANCILANPSDDKVRCESDSIDLLLCVEVGPVIQSDWFIEEGLRVLRNDGVIVGVFWNLLSLRGLFGHARAAFAGDFDFYKIPYPSWKRKLSNRGFRILYEEGYCWFPFSRASNSALVPYFTLLEKVLGLRKLIFFSPWVVFIAQKKDGDFSLGSGDNS
jgi:SAM-dependent methyltransferase